MSSETMPRATLIYGAVLALSCAAFLAMLWQGVHQTVLALPATLGWIAALLAMRPLVPKERLGSLYFAFGVMALMIFFIHETYEYTGATRLFPAVIGFAGVALSALDILSISNTRIGQWITRVLGAALDESEITERGVGRELLVFGAMAVAGIGIYLVGFLIAGPLFVAAWMMIGGGSSLRHAFYGALGTLIFTYLLFEVALKYELYRGIAVIWLIETYWYGN